MLYKVFGYESLTLSVLICVCFCCISQNADVCVYITWLRFALFSIIDTIGSSASFYVLGADCIKCIFVMLMLPGSLYHRQMSEQWSPPDIFLASWQTPIFQSPCPNLGKAGTKFWLGALMENYHYQVPLAGWLIFYLGAKSGMKVFRIYPDFRKSAP
jgi:hypothetical protein